MKVAIYCRLSEEDRNKLNKDDDSESIQNQKNMLIEYTLKMGWQIYDIYSDDDFKGSDRNRPEFNRLLQDAEKKLFDIVLCKSQSRFTRELELVEKYIHGKFLEWNIRFIGYADNADTDNAGNKKSRQINGLVNEWYLEDLSNNIRSVFETKKRAGQHIGSFALYGYEKDPDKKGHLIIDEEAAAVVREVFDLFISGYGKTSIARILNEKGIPNPTEYKRLKGLRFKHTSKNSNSKLWKYYTIQSMLCNEMYIGTMVQSKQKNISYKSSKTVQIPKNQWVKVPNMHEAIIDMDTWNKAQDLIKQRFKPWGDSNKIGIFARKVKCLQCGYYLRTQKIQNRRNLQCSTKYVSKDACDGCCIDIDKLERIVLDELKSIIKNLGIKNSEINSKVKYENRLQKEIDLLKNKIENCKKDIDNCTKALKNLYTDKIKGIITSDEFVEFSKGFHQEKENYQKNLDDYEEQLKELNIKLKTSLNKEELLKKYQNINKLERIHVDTLIDYIEVGKRIPKTKDRVINIYWNF